MREKKPRPSLPLPRAHAGPWPRLLQVLHQLPCPVPLDLGKVKEYSQKTQSVAISAPEVGTGQGRPGYPNPQDQMSSMRPNQFRAWVMQQYRGRGRVKAVLVPGHSSTGAESTAISVTLAKDKAFRGTVVVKKGAVQTDDPHRLEAIAEVQGGGEGEGRGDQ